MKITFNSLAAGSIISLSLLLSGCGHYQQQSDSAAPQSFAAAAVDQQTLEEATAIAHTADTAAGGSSGSSTTGGDISTKPPQDSLKPNNQTDKVSPAHHANPSPNAKQQPLTGTSVKSKIKPSTAGNHKSTASTAPDADSKKKMAAAQQNNEPNTKPEKSYSNTLLWSEFFDNEKQDTPSDKFWELSGKQVKIKGYMGEVLSFDKHWFLLIPAPGAECPFDNGDETYWNKIMMVFVPSDTKLRYTSGALELTGTLDAGIKIDESGYKTMFRLYDATFEELSE
ncbi:hypothetical protein LQV63_19050 [Paenibacillus profundus]|uniref:Lipoprotein n=1 Tax=Paenibacillus profundus TaxID=1173085 RepID=A0ABS8YHW0_9BACL|nr:hypothetical protein [Paenibacillus profundus]MCE5171401.1 hypothetical protein [Paenibacillus profundus]